MAFEGLWSHGLPKVRIYRVLMRRKMSRFKGSVWVLTRALFDWISPKVVSFLILGVFGEEITKGALLDVFGAKKCGKRRNLKKTLKFTKSKLSDGVKTKCVTASWREKTKVTACTQKDFTSLTDENWWQRHRRPSRPKHGGVTPSQRPSWNPNRRCDDVTIGCDAVTSQYLYI